MVTGSSGHDSVWSDTKVHLNIRHVGWSCVSNDSLVVNEVQLFMCRPRRSGLTSEPKIG